MTIEHPTLKKQFEQFSELGSDEEKKVFWEAFKEDFEGKTKAEQEAMREAWEANVSNIEKRLKAIDVKLSKQVGETNVEPDNVEEACF